jgi:hypothetical protein
MLVFPFKFFARESVNVLDKKPPLANHNRIIITQLFKRGNGGVAVQTSYCDCMLIGYRVWSIFETVG